MTLALNFVILIDDSAPDNFVHRRMLVRAGFDQNINEFEYAEEALDFLRSAERPRVDAVIVDINMPRMNGYEFVDQYAKLYPELKARAPILILTSSIDPSDQEWAESHPEIWGMVRKPLTIDVLNDYIVQLAEA